LKKKTNSYTTSKISESWGVSVSLVATAHLQNIWTHISYLTSPKSKSTSHSHFKISSICYGNFHPIENIQELYKPNSTLILIL